MCGLTCVPYCLQQDEKEIIDLRTAIDLRGPDTQGSFEAQCSFQIVTPGKWVMADIVTAREVPSQKKTSES